MSEQNDDSVPKRGPRMTQQNLQAMKAGSQKAERPDIAIRKKTGEFFADLISVFSFGQKTTKTSPCDLNGHVLPRVWDGEFPRCTHCNKELRSADDIGGR